MLIQNNKLKKTMKYRNYIYNIISFEIKILNKPI